MKLFGKKNIILHKKQAGFTLVELMIASVVFSVILLLVAGAVVRFTNAYQRGVIENSTQNVARSILDTLTESVQFSGADPAVLSPPNNGYCLNGTRYSMQLYRQLEDDVDWVLTEEKGTNDQCTDEFGTTKQEMLSPHMRLSKLAVSNTGLPNGMWTITVKVAYGDEDLFKGCAGDGGGCTANGPDPVCRADTGSQWCAVRELSTTVHRRL